MQLKPVRATWDTRGRTEDFVQLVKQVNTMMFLVLNLLNLVLIAPPAQCQLQQATP